MGGITRGGEQPAPEAAGAACGPPESDKTYRVPQLVVKVEVRALLVVRLDGCRLFKPLKPGLCGRGKSFRGAVRAEDGEWKRNE